MEAEGLIQITLMAILVVVTAVYAWRTHVMSVSAEKFNAKPD